MIFETLSFSEGLIFVLLGLLFFKEQIVPWLSQKLGFAKAEMTAEEVISYYQQELGKHIGQLSDYYNHDTTKRMEKMVSLLEKIDKSLERIMIRHDEYEKYGIKTRCDKKP